MSEGTPGEFSSRRDIVAREITGRLPVEEGGHRERDRGGRECQGSRDMGANRGERSSGGRSPGSYSRGGRCRERDRGGMDC